MLNILFTQISFCKSGNWMLGGLAVECVSSCELQDLHDLNKVFHKISHLNNFSLKCTELLWRLRLDLLILLYVHNVQLKYFELTCTEIWSFHQLWELKHFWQYRQRKFFRLCDAKYELPEPSSRQRCACKTKRYFSVLASWLQ